MSSAKGSIARKSLIALSFIFLVLLFGFVPFIIAFLYGVSLGSEINPTFLNGMITASGIFLGFISAMSISRSELLDYADYLLITVDFAFFFITISVYIFPAQLRNIITVNELAWITGSLNVNAVTAIILIGRLRKFKNP
ncbi:hypothetical protein J7K27_10335 [Candidatus Bathyarchaeota archaeon]|nr:hypothetical protein [Candidatus Bathyarchaeota archaeon]